MTGIGLFRIVVIWWSVKLSMSDSEQRRAEETVRESGRIGAANHLTVFELLEVVRLLHQLRGLDGAVEGRGRQPLHEHRHPPPLLGIEHAAVELVEHLRGVRLAQLRDLDPDLRAALPRLGRFLLVLGHQLRRRELLRRVLHLGALELLRDLGLALRHLLQHLVLRAFVGLAGRAIIQVRQVVAGPRVAAGDQPGEPPRLVRRAVELVQRVLRILRPEVGEAGAVLGAIEHRSRFLLPLPRRVDLLARLLAGVLQLGPRHHPVLVAIEELDVALLGLLRLIREEPGDLLQVSEREGRNQIGRVAEEIEAGLQILEAEPRPLEDVGDRRVEDGLRLGRRHGSQPRFHRRSRRR